MINTKIKPVEISVRFKVTDIKKGKVMVMKKEHTAYTVTVVPHVGVAKYRIVIIANTISEMKSELAKMISKTAIYHLK